MHLMQYYLQLQTGFHLIDHQANLTYVLPALSGWAASPDLLLLLAEHAHGLQPEVVVGCSSGAAALR